MTCFDANVLIEILLERQRATACKAAIEMAQRTTNGAAITMLSLDLAMYYVEKHKVALPLGEEFLRLFTWLPLAEADGHWAFAHYARDDFEDALQIACAKREACTTFVT